MDATFFQETLRCKSVATPSGCLEWQGGVGACGYGIVGDASNRRLFSAHRVAYELAKGPIPQGLQIDHLCRNRRCVNPEHMEAVTQRENIRRGHGPSGINAKKTHCIRGHPLSGENLYVYPDGSRYCMTCSRLRRRGLV